MVESANVNDQYVLGANETYTEKFFEGISGPLLITSYRPTVGGSKNTRFELYIGFPESNDMRFYSHEVTDADVTAEFSGASNWRMVPDGGYLRVDRTDLSGSQHYASLELQAHRFLL